MKFTHQSPLVILCLIFTVITLFSCSKDSDLMADYVALDPDIGTIARFVANDSYIITISDNPEDDTFEIIVNNNDSTETSSGGSNGTAVDDSYQISSDVSIILDVLANDTFEDKEVISIIETSQPNNGNVVINEDNTLTYTPEEILTTEPVTDTFTYTAEVQNNDGSVTSGEAEVSIIMEVVNNADKSTQTNPYPQSNPNISPWDVCQDGNPIGGGPGYDRIVTSGDITVTSSDTYMQLKSKIEGATSGQVVFINNDVNMDLTGLGSTTIGVPAGVTIASDRGNGSSQGAFLYSNEVQYGGSGSLRPIFRVDGEGVRITGFTMRGPYGFSGTYDAYDETVRRLKFCIASNYDNTEIDNMHGYNWPSSFISFSRYGSPTTVFGPSRQSVGGKIHHNYIHNNLQNGFGYGCDMQNAKSVEIYANIFHSNRHDIQSRGSVGAGYEAYCNTTISEFSDGTKVYAMVEDGSGNSIPSYNPRQTGSTHKNYDSHPEYYCGNDNVNYGLCDPPSGDKYYIHHNDFKDDGVARHSGAYRNVGMGGVAATYVRVEYNRTVRPYLKNWDESGNIVSNTAPEAEYFFGQTRCLAPLPKGNITLIGNVLNGATPPGQTISSN